MLAGELAKTLLRRSAERRRAATEHAAQTLALVRAATQAAELPTGARIWLIGSLAWGGFGTRSDIDLVLDNVDEGSETALELDLLRRTGCPVDLLKFTTLPVSFQDRVTREGLLLHV